MKIMHPYDGKPFFCATCGAPEWECRCPRFEIETSAVAQARKIAFDASMKSDKE